jgi:SAM-dependent methyltransferase
VSRAADKVPARIAWAVDLLDVQPEDQILEFGCGPGVSVGLACERLGGGRITAIDRSATAIERTRARIDTHIAAGRAVLRNVDLAGFDGESGSFDKAFGVNVNVFWTTGAEVECAVLRRVLRPHGVVRLVYDGPAPGSARHVGPSIAATLERNGFAARVIRDATATMVCVMGSVTPGR